MSENPKEQRCRPDLDEILVLKPLGACDPFALEQRPVLASQILEDRARLIDKYSGMPPGNGRVVDEKHRVGDPPYQVLAWCQRYLAVSPDQPVNRSLRGRRG